MKIARVLLASLTLAAVAACGDSTTPTAPSGSTPTTTGTGGAETTAAGALKLTAPVAFSPDNGARVDTQRPTLVVNNPTAPNAPSATLRVRFTVRDDANNPIHTSAALALGQGRTSYVLPNDLDRGRTYRWSAEVLWNDTVGGTSDVRSFSTEAPAPPVDNCQGGPLEIVTCQRAKAADHMNSAQFLVFMRAVARNLNDNGIGGGPFGILRKNTGHHCEGYSCDVLCAGNGPGQQQWDIVNDIDSAQSPTWSGPHSGNIRVDVCEIQ